MQLKKFGMVLKSATQQTDDTSTGRFLATMLSATGQLENEIRAERTLAGMKSRVDSGRWQSAAPTGYLTGGKSGPSLVVDPDRGHLIAKLFELVATGAHTKASALPAVTALRIAFSQGCSTDAGDYPARSSSTLFTRARYLAQNMGQNRVKGDYDPLVSRSVFDRVQTVLTGRAPAPVSHVRERDDSSSRLGSLC